MLTPPTWHPKPPVAGPPKAPASVSITRGLNSLGGSFTLPADPCYTTISYRLASLGDVGSGNEAGTAIMGWKELTAAEIAAGTFTIPDPVTVGASSVAVPTGRYRLDMRADAGNGATPAGWLLVTRQQQHA